MELRWGEVTDGLQIALIPETNAGAVHCWIRNALPKTISYNSYMLGDPDCVSIEVRNGDEWRRLERAKSAMRSCKGIGPSEQTFCKLDPWQSIKEEVPMLNFTRFTPTPINENSFTLQMRKEFPHPSMLKATLLVDLGDFEWPENALKGPLEIRISQRLFGPGHNKEITVQSLPTRLDGAVLQRFIEVLREPTK